LGSGIEENGIFGENLNSGRTEIDRSPREWHVLAIASEQSSSLASRADYSP